MNLDTFSARHVSRFALCAALLSTGTAIAQSARYTTFGTPCANQRLIYARVSGTLPVRGKTASINVSATRYTSGLLYFAPRRYASGINLSALGMTNCRLYVVPHGSFSVPLSFGFAGTSRLNYRVPSTARLGTTFYNQAIVLLPRANAANLVTSNAAQAVIGTEPALTLTEIKNFAPIVRIHPSEAYNPMDPMAFIRVSRFRHHRTLRSDQGYNKYTRKWVTTNSKDSAYFNIPTSVINSFGLHSNGKNRRPRDANSGKDWDVYLESNGRQYGDRTPNRDVPAFYYYRRRGDVHEVQYWWFSGFNDAPLTVNHQGDWEHVTVHIKNRQVISAYFSAHNGGKTYTRSQMLFSGSHPVAYMAKGTHASYPKPGRYHSYIDDCRDGGQQWNISLNLKSLSTQPWKNFAGAWGAVGQFATTTGPLGPWHKRLKP